MKDALRRAEVQTELADALLGHANARNAGRGYGTGYRNLPWILLRALKRVPSPLGAADPVRDSPPGSSATRAPADDPLPAARRNWFEANAQEAFAQFVRGDFAAAVVSADASSDDLREASNELIRRDAERIIEALQSDYRRGDVTAGRAAARAINATLERPIPLDTPEFDKLCLWALWSTAAIQEARIQWSSGQRLYKALPPTDADLEASFGSVSTRP
jgi:hypothetical protein